MTMTTPSRSTPLRRVKLLACEIFYRELCHLVAVAPLHIDLEFLPKGLHDLETVDMRSQLQDRIDAADAEGVYDAILLAYARCNDGTVGLTARTTPLVIPKAHDCITLFFGSREAYRNYFDAHPGAYYHTTGWAERNNQGEGGYSERPAFGQQGVMAKLGLAESYDQLVAKHGRDNADYILETLGGWQRAYDTLCYIEMGVCDETRFLDEARVLAEKNHWTLDRQRGTLSLLERLLAGDWDDDFVVVAPGKTLAAQNDDTILTVNTEIT